ncbi:MAG: hypothetical protein IH840_13775 [Candidatus Heimdallarchaeota archaeon]|nr:hypothetical protein [Candidatus Heimdallarchaeota archaeon]
MSDYEEGEMLINRLLVLFQLIAVPLYFAFFSYIWRSEIKRFFATDTILIRNLPNWVVWFEVYLAIPIFFSLPWVTITLIRATRIADAYTLMGRALGRVRIDQKLFYGINAGFTLVFIILPFASPMITVIGVFVAVFLLFDKIKVAKISFFIWFIPALILSFIPGLIAIAFYSNYAVLWETIFETWRTRIDTIFGVGLALAIAITMGNFLAFLLEKGVRDNRSDINPYRIVYLLKFILFMIFLGIFLFEDSVIINTLNIIAGVIAALEFILRRITKLPSESGGANLMVFAFIAINFLTNQLRSGSTEAVFKAFLIVLSSLIFFLLFFISYRYAEDEELLSGSRS